MLTCNRRLCAYCATWAFLLWLRYARASEQIGKKVPRFFVTKFQLDSLTATLGPAARKSYVLCVATVRILSYIYIIMIQNRLFPADFFRALIGLRDSPVLFPTIYILTI